MVSSNLKRCPESRSSVGRVDDELNEIFQLDGVWETTWEEPIGDMKEMVLVDAKQYAAFLKWQAGNHEGGSTNPSLEHKGKYTDVSEKKENTDPTQLEKQESNIQSSQHDAENHTRDSPSDDEARALCEEFERNMDRMSALHEFQHILKQLEMPQLMDHDVRLFKLVKLLEKVKNMDDEKREKSSQSGRN
ncbi:hypothetical protein FVER53590_13564 [Fusarium verticillioides]|nr:hypothetical protein FVER53590_13564 [Fusarium verticillioides]